VGLANLASGLAGGIPATAALARTALNIKSGATSRAAGIINGLTIIILSTALFGMFKYLPLPVVAAILVNVASRMIEWPEVTLLYKMDKPMFAVAIISALVCILEDPTLGIIAGALLGMVRVLLSMRGAHATLLLYQGRTCRLHYLFDGAGDHKRAVRTCRAKLTGEPSPEEIEAEVAKSARVAAVLDRVEANYELRERRAAEAAADARAAADATAAAQFHPRPPTDAHGRPLQAAAGGATAAADGAAGSASAAGAGGKAVRRSRRAGRRASAAEGDLVSTRPDPDRDARLPCTAVYCLPGYFTYVSAQAHRDRVRALLMEGEASLPGVRAVAFSLVETYYADPDALEAVGTLVEELGRAGHEVYLLGFHAAVLRAIQKAHFYHDVRHFADYAALLRFQRRQVDADGVYVTPAPPAGAHHGGSGGHAVAVAPVAAAGQVPVVAAPHAVVEAGAAASAPAPLAAGSAAAQQPAPGAALHGVSPVSSGGAEWN